MGNHSRLSSTARGELSGAVAPRPARGDRCYNQAVTGRYRKARKTMPSATSLGATGCREKQAVRPGLGVRAINALIFRLAAGENRMMGYEAKDRARRAAKHGNGAYWGRKWEANKESSRTRRRTGGGKSEKSSPINLSGRLPCDRARGKSRSSAFVAEKDPVILRTQPDQGRLPSRSCFVLPSPVWT
jgi:hypothetical protein